LKLLEGKLKKEKKDDVTVELGQVRKRTGTLSTTTTTTTNRATTTTPDGAEDV